MADAHPPLGERELLELALELPPGERDDFLRERCADEALRRRVQRLVEAHDRAAAFTGRHADLARLDESRSLELEPGARIGPYRIVGKLGEGGMGVVFLAEQEAPIRRSVALKVIRVGTSTEQGRARFEAERQTLALMDHPGIARIFDSGTTPDGHPYFAMEHVPGPPLVRYCDERDLALEERLRLFADVCLAVQHAHQKGIVHRDLKPSNLLVVEVDGRPLPKVIDFGVAKAVGAELSLDLALTQDGQILGTLAYMSPEQLSGGADAVDTRSDVYALGLILYQLLTGGPPVPLEGRSPSEAVARLSEAEAPRLRSVRPDLDPDLEVIAGKALERERERRYASAAALADDVRRFLADEPILARPPSTAYQLRKLARRHRTAVVGGALTAAAVLAGLTVSTVLWLRERDARSELDVQYARERDARQELDRLYASERDARQRLDRSYGVTREVVEFLGGLLGTAPAAGEPAETVTLAAALERGELSLERGRNRRSPEALGWIHAILGDAFLTLGRDDAAERNLAASLETHAAEGAARIRAMIDLGTARLRRGDLAGADAATAEGLELARAEPGPGSLDLVRSLAIRSSVLRTSDRYDEARAAAEELLALTDTLDGAAPDTVMHRARASRLLGEIELAARQPARALPHLERALADSEAAGAGDTLEHAEVLGSLALAAAQLGDPDAVAMSERSIAATEAVFGRAHEASALAWNNHAMIVAMTTGSYADALAALRQTVEIERALGDEPRPALGVQLANLAAWLLRGSPDQVAEAEVLAGEAVELLDRTLGPDHRDSAMALAVWARARGRGRDRRRRRCVRARARGDPPQPGPAPLQHDLPGIPPRPRRRGCGRPDRSRASVARGARRRERRGEPRRRPARGAPRGPARRALRAGRRGVDGGGGRARGRALAPSPW